VSTDNPTPLRVLIRKSSHAPHAVYLAIALDRAVIAQGYAKAQAEERLYRGVCIDIAAAKRYGTPDRSLISTRGDEAAWNERAVKVDHYARPEVVNHMLTMFDAIEVREA
jgi:hypothetical protein